jgi:glyoxylase-like metal-dependent hydrolase (beta-lactamase superfamily II)
MLVAPGVEMLEITATVMGAPRSVYPTLLTGPAEAILFDGGFLGMAPEFVEALDAAGSPVGTLTRILVTHQDQDHIGGIPAILAAAGRHVPIVSSIEEKPYIEGEKRLVKMRPGGMEAALAALPEDQREAYRERMANPPRLAVDETVADGEMLPFCGGLQAILVPGHTVGHTCYFHVPSRTLIAGDALNIGEGGSLVGPAEWATPDMALAKASLGKLAGLDVAAVVCYHGGLYRADDANERIAELARG